MQISASQIIKFRRCQRLYAFEYVEDRKPPTSDKQAFGSEVHKELEGWLKEGILPGDTSAGRTAKQGIKKGWLPVPDDLLFVEQHFEIEWDADIYMLGFIDCVVPPELESDGIPVVIDHKTTSSLNWVKTEEQLKMDEQAIIYVIVAAKQFKTEKVKARWVYYAATNPKNKARAPAGAKPVQVEFDVSSPEFLNLVKKLIKDAREMKKIIRQEIKGNDLPPKPTACEMYGGCPHKEYCKLSPGDSIAAFIEKEVSRA